LRRASRPVWVRCWCRGFLPESFEVGSLRMEFLRAEEEVSGKYPAMSGPAAYDRLRVIRDCEDWDRCVVMDYDQLVLCDLAPLMDLEMGDRLLAAHLQGPGVDMSYAMRVWLKRPMPEGWEHVASHPYFLMPPVMNLKAMREAGTWEKFLRAHEAFGADEQLSLTAATEGRTMALEKKWNLFPKLHIPEGEVPAGVIHWSGWPKPWHRGAKVWRPDIWESERTSWEHLRMGIWKKPLSMELEPEDLAAALALVERGWRVKVFCSRFASEAVVDGGVADEGGVSIFPRFPDFEVFPSNKEIFHQELQREAADQVRLGAWEDPADWLDGAPLLPKYLVMKGGVDAEEADRLRGLGYDLESRLMGGEWPAGGPIPRALAYDRCRWGTGAQPGEDLYFHGASGGDVRPALKARPTREKGAGAKKVGLCVIATANYRMFLRPLLRSVRANFLPGHEVTVFLFTDGEVEEAEDLRVIRVEHSEWPGMAIRRYALFREHADEFEKMEYLYYLDADMRVIGRVGEEILGDLVGTIHPGFHDKQRQKFTYERRRESKAWIPPEEGIFYYCGAFQGGRRERYLEAAREMAGWIDEDALNGVTAVWHDESHWNRYLVDSPPSLSLTPSYCWYPDGRSKEFEGKIAVVLKDARRMRMAVKAG
jgi:histo-blood group ABO system transferase